MVSKVAEDYLEVIHSIIEEEGYVRVKNIAERLNIKPASVSEMLNKLKDDGLIYYEKYGGITLTKKGMNIAKSVRNRHKTIKKFLEIILIPEKIAEKSACEIEHNLDKRTIKQLTKFLEFTEKSQSFSKWQTKFERYCEE